jgi:hypothetical protein
MVSGSEIIARRNVQGISKEIIVRVKVEDLILGGVVHIVLHQSQPVRITKSEKENARSLLLVPPTGDSACSHAKEHQVSSSVVSLSSFSCALSRRFFLFAADMIFIFSPCALITARIESIEIG